MKVTIKHWHAVAQWRWDTGKTEDDSGGKDSDSEDDVCGICRVPYEGCCPSCKVPGDDCPLSALGRMLAHIPHALSAEVDWDAHVERTVPNGSSDLGYSGEKSCHRRIVNLSLSATSCTLCPSIFISLVVPSGPRLSLPSRHHVHTMPPRRRAMGHRSDLQLPDELLLIIFALTDDKSLLRMARLSKHINELVVIIVLERRGVALSDLQIAGRTPPGTISLAIYPLLLAHRRFKLSQSLTTLNLRFEWVTSDIVYDIMAINRLYPRLRALREVNLDFELKLPLHPRVVPYMYQALGQLVRAHRPELDVQRCPVVVVGHNQAAAWGAAASDLADALKPAFREGETRWGTVSFRLPSKRSSPHVAAVVEMEISEMTGLRWDGSMAACAPEVVTALLEGGTLEKIALTSELWMRLSVVDAGLELALAGFLASNRGIKRLTLSGVMSVDGAVAPAVVAAPPSQQSAPPTKQKPRWKRLFKPSKSQPVVRVAPPFSSTSTVPIPTAPSPAVSAILPPDALPLLESLKANIRMASWMLTSAALPSLSTLIVELHAPAADYYIFLIDSIASRPTLSQLTFHLYSWTPWDVPAPALPVNIAHLVLIFEEGRRMVAGDVSRTQRAACAAWLARCDALDIVQLVDVGDGGGKLAEVCKKGLRAGTQIELWASGKRVKF
ncbi:RING finger domain-containing protein [Mycena kentingensis (nom. inval.)]|nr:RING finger domain-containing protein [Mycena kentingensis (nom. inval.)]